ncbi:hypothetical protein Tco_0629305 [Tanacetum coccineum]|uniref:Retrovirus-related Pol polyprotein from transposon TNT 1-94 n=1 Tax=Tanacetum coccineum TaxID=301880 RepID=A0ABQ4WT09_9ASTR
MKPLERLTLTEKRINSKGIGHLLAIGSQPADMTDAKYNSQDEKAHSTILLSLSDEVLYEVADEETAAFAFPRASSSSIGNSDLNLSGLSAKGSDRGRHQHKKGRPWKVNCPKLKKKVQVADVAKDVSGFGNAMRSPATAIDCKTPIEVWSGKPADYSKLRVFGCPAYYHAIEFGSHLKEVRVIFSRDVTFDEDYLFRVKQDPIESKLQDGVSRKVEDIPKQVEHVVPGDMDHDDTSPDDHTNLQHVELEHVGL